MERFFEMFITIVRVSFFVGCVWVAIFGNPTTVESLTLIGLGVIILNTQVEEMGDK